MAAPRQVIEISIGATDLIELEAIADRERNGRVGFNGRAFSWPITPIRRPMPLVKRSA
jgi:hypothetical protein